MSLVYVHITIYTAMYASDSENVILYYYSSVEACSPLRVLLGVHEMSETMFCLIYCNKVSKCSLQYSSSNDSECSSTVPVSISRAPSGPVTITIPFYFENQLP